jgi:hypothetical protein
MGAARGAISALRSGVGDFEWTEDRIRVFWLAAAVVPLFFTIGVISTMRWIGRNWRELQRDRGTRKLNAKYSNMARANTSVPFVPPAAPFPLRNEEGPRDWTPTQFRPEP